MKEVVHFTQSDIGQELCNLVCARKGWKLAQIIIAVEIKTGLDGTTAIVTATVSEVKTAEPKP